MREILFRGKTIANESKWVEGFYNHIPCGRFLCDEHCIQTINEDGKIGQLYDVYENTVGQFTGLTDKNGKKIFEGDIVRYTTFNDFDCYSVVKFGEYKQDGSAGEYNPRDCIGWYVDVDNFTCPDWAENDPTYFSSYLNQQNLNEVASYCEIIGNIHDNPELLGGAEDE